MGAVERASETAERRGGPGAPSATEMVHRHRARLLAVARRHSFSPEDAEDAVQRAVEILLKERFGQAVPGWLENNRTGR